MKFVVDALPENKGACPFSEWRPYPPIVEEPGYYQCRFMKGRDNDNICDLDREKGACEFLVEFGKVSAETTVAQGVVIGELILRKNYDDT